MSKVIETRALPSLSEMTDRQLTEQRNILLDELEGLTHIVKTEKRALSGKEENRFNAVKDEIRSIDRELQAKRLDFDNSPHTKNYSPQQREEIRAFVDFVRTGVMNEKYAQRDLSSGASGVIVPKTVANLVIQKVKELAPVFQRMFHLQVTGNLSVPSYPWDAHTTGFIEDFQNITTSGGTFTTVDLTSHAFASLALIGRNLISRTDLPVEEIIIQQIGMSIANFISNEIFNGTTFSGSFGSISQTVTAASPTAIGVDDVISLQMKVPSMFQRNACWVMHPNSFLAIRQLKSTTGVPLLVGDDTGLQGDLGFTLLNKPVFLDENAPATLAAGTRSIFYGDIEAGFVCNTNAPLTTQVLIERYVDINCTGIISSMDLDFSLVQSRAMAALVH